MNPTGYIPIPRFIFDDPVWAEKRTYSKAEAMLDLYQRAAYAPRRQYVDGKLIPLEPGEVVASLRYLGEAWGWSKNKVAKFLDENRDRISIKNGTGITIITISFLTTYYCESPNNGTAKGHGRDTEGTRKGQQKDKIEQGNKETKKEGEVGATPAPLDFDVNDMPGYQAPAAIAPGTPAFDLMKKIGKPAAQIWTQTNAAELFTTPAHADLALEWLEARCAMGKPLTGHIELTPLVALFNKHSLADLRLMVEYSAGKYPNLYPDRIERTKKQRLNLDPNDLAATRQNVHQTASGLKLVK